MRCKCPNDCACPLKCLSDMRPEVRLRWRPLLAGFLGCVQSFCCLALDFRLLRNCACRR